VVLKLWQARDSFMSERLMQKFEHERNFDWNDLRQLLRRGVEIDQARITQACVHGFRFLADIAAEKQTLASDRYQREYALWDPLRGEVATG